MNKEQQKLIIFMAILILIFVAVNILLAFLNGDDVIDKLITSMGGVIGILIMEVLFYFGFRTVKPKKDMSSDNHNTEK